MRIDDRISFRATLRTPGASYFHPAIYPEDGRAAGEVQATRNPTAGDTTSSLYGGDAGGNDSGRERADAGMRVAKLRRW